MMNTIVNTEAIALKKALIGRTIADINVSHPDVMINDQPLPESCLRIDSIRFTDGTEFHFSKMNYDWNVVWSGKQPNGK